MPTLKRTNTVSNKAKKQPLGHVNKYYGMYVGIIKDNGDAERNGSIRVWIPEFGNTPDDESSWIRVAYCSPFAGATPLENGSGFNNSQTSYGMWMIPPDTGVKVGVMFANGDIACGYWFGCLFDQYANNMVPAISSSTNNDQYGGKSVPVSEYNKTDKNINYNDPKRPVHEPSFNSIADQGLINDNIRGTTTTSARRDSVSQVYGIATPGPKNPNSKTNRMGGSRIIMDDGEGSEYLAFKTRSGNYVKLDDTNGLIYIINKRGTGWVQIDDYGDIDFFGAGSISFRAEEDFNIRADRNINIEAGQDIHIKASKDYSGTDYVAAPSGGSGGNIIVEANNKLDLTVVDQTKFNLKNTLDMIVDKEAKVKVNSSLNLTTNNTLYNSLYGTDMTIGGDFVITVDGGSNISTKSSTKIYGTGDILLKSDANLKITAATNVETFGGTAVNQTGGTECNIVGGTAIKGTAGGLISWNGTPATPTSPISEPIVTASKPLIPVNAVAIDMVTKTNILPTFSDKFNRDKHLVKTIISRFMTYEPCPEHMLKAGDPKITKYSWYSKSSLVDKPKAKVYKVESEQPPQATEVKEDEIVVPIISEKFECGKWVTPETAKEGRDKNNRVTINPRELYDPLFKAASERYGVPSCLLSRLAYQESRYNKYAYNSGSHASGIMQIVTRWHPTVKDPFDPNEAIPYAAKYLSDLYRQFGSWDKAMAAYNWGPGSLSNAIKKYGDDWVSHLPQETYNYITQIGGDIGLYA